MVTNKEMFARMEGVPEEQVDELYAIWFETCLPDEVKDGMRAENIVASDKMAMRMVIATHGYDTARKALLALPLSPDHDGSRHRDHEGFPLIRRDLVTLRREALNLADFWDSRR